MMADENEKRKTEFRALKGKQESENQARVTELAKSDGKVDTEFKNRKEEVVQINSWYDGENETRKVEIADLGKVLNKENEARKEAIDKLEAFVKSASVSAVGDLDARITAEASAREAEDKALSDRIASQVVAVREEKMAALNTKADGQNNDRISDIDNLRKQHAVNSAYSGGGENLTFNGAYCNAGSGLDVESGVFTCPIGGTYMFQFHLATHDNKKALLSIRVNDKEIASVFDQNHKDNHKNSMAGTNVVHEVKRGDQVTLYAYTGTWLADFPANHYTHFVGLLLQPSQEEMDLMLKEAEEAVAA